MEVTQKGTKKTLKLRDQEAENWVDLQKSFAHSTLKIGILNYSLDFFESW